ncbi:hypothetical protein FNV43_RR08209 [Rhamnella rubrinervis]|uniref:Protein SCAR n=1 Tax=Rhamnella rubrinervis TaxID=2594499 RepID=A0A8K0HGC2_9ROSA|nr:hypothetical protein FNV43_RR08209 [Rhamnella rubrinervis]
MPLVRFQVRNEYGLGQPELYKEANKEDPKAVLDGVAVSGLVGILRQLGDLAEFAAEVFHGLQEQVMTTASRSHKLMIRVQHIEAALPPLEKVVLAQTSHIHFAYTAGSEWHPRIRNERNHFIYNDLPRFIMDSYEECRDPPRLHVLDKFDSGGRGSCLKRYSDPTFFKRASATSDEPNVEKVQRDRKARRTKKKRSSKRNGDVSRGASISNTRNCSTQFISPSADGRSSPSHTASTVDMALKYDLGDQSNSFDSRTESGYIECVFHPSSSVQADEQESKEMPSSKLVHHNDTLDSVLPDDDIGFVDDSFPRSSLQEPVTSGSSGVTWDEKAEIVEPNGQEGGVDKTPNMLLYKSDTDTHRGGETPDMLMDKSEMDAHGREVTPDMLMYMSEIDALGRGETPNILMYKTDIDAHGGEAGNFRIGDQMEVHLGAGDEIIPESISSRNQINDIESETDNYMDALNTIESESENDLDCQTKQQVEQSAFNLNNEGNDGMHELSMQCKDHNPPTFESQTTSYISSDKEITSDLLNSVSSESAACEQMPVSEMSLNKEVPSDLSNSLNSESQHNELMFQLAGETSNSDCSVGSDRIDDIHDGSKLESVTTGDSVKLESVTGDNVQLASVVGDDPNLESVTVDLSSSASKTTDIQDPSGHKVVSSFCESQESSADVSSSHSVKIWTNGGLLGLEPSKPPDFSMSRATTQDSLNKSKDETNGPLNDTYMLHSVGNGRKINILAENMVQAEKDSSSKCYTSCQDDQENSTTKIPHGISPPSLDAKNGDFGDPNLHNGYSHVNSKDLKETHVVKLATVLPVAPDINSTSTEASKENDESSSLVFGLSRRLLSNGFGRKFSHINDNKIEPASSVTSVLEQRSEPHRLPERAFEEQFGFGSALDLLTSSPPLEHMKISFHPVDSFENSKLKLKFSDGSQSHESIRDMFPSFQLIPEPAIPVDEFDSDSDDDTFCRSSPYMSDDCLSHHSDSNSEQWESRETPERKDHEIYDALCGISSTECTSNSMEIGRIKQATSGNGVEASISDSVLDLPNFDAVTSALQQETKDDSDPKNYLDLRPGVTPAPPPLPPVQWCVLKPHLDVTEGKQDVASESFEHAFGAKVLGSSTFQQPKLAPAKQQQTNEEPIAFKPKCKDAHKKEANQALNDKGMDDKGDFLQQIRAKSFNLRRTVAEKPRSTPGPAANVKVTAILEKANAIRQAVGSDDGEDDDKWSDT